MDGFNPLDASVMVNDWMRYCFFDQYCIFTFRQPSLHCNLFLLLFSLLNFFFHFDCDIVNMIVVRFSVLTLRWIEKAQSGVPYRTFVIPGKMVDDELMPFNFRFTVLIGGNGIIAKSH